MTASRCVVLLRGVNVGAHNRIAMPAFRSLLGDAGCTDVQTHLQSGNAVVGWDGSPDQLAAVVMAQLSAALGLAVPVLVRTARELDAVVSGNPFADQAVDPRLLHAVFLSGPPPELDLAALLPDRVVPDDRVLYVAYARASHGTRASKLLNDSRFPVVASARNWRTVLALRDLSLRTAMTSE